KVRMQLGRRQLMELREEFRDPLNVQGDPSVRPGQVELDTIARAQDYRFAAEARHQAIEGAAEPIRRNSQALAQVHGCRAVAAANHQQHHGAPPAVKLCCVTMVSRSKAKAMMVSRATRRPRR